MKIAQYRKIMLSIVLIAALTMCSITAVAAYRETAYDFTINGISAKTDGVYSEKIPMGDFSAEVSITNKGDAASITVLLAEYGSNGQMIKAQYSNAHLGAGETSICTFDVKNTDGEITALKTFLLNSNEELIPVAKAFTLRNYDVVVSAYMNSAEELIVQTIDGKEYIVNGSQSYHASFADYEVGSRFYLEEPTGEFDVPVYVNDIPYTVHFDEIYYEVTRKNTGDDVWVYENNHTYYAPYIATVYISGETDPGLAGHSIYITLRDFAYGNWAYDTVIKNDGSFSLELPQGDGISNTNVWLAPKSLAFGQVNISKTVSDDDERPDDLPDDEHPDDLPTEDLITPLVGTWAASPTEEIIVAEDGTITYNDVEYAPEYVKRGSSTRAYLADKDLETEMYINFRVSSGYASCSFNNDRYYKDRSWEIVTLTPENWSEYFDLEETLEFEYDAWGALEAAHLLYTYSLKETYSERLDEDLSNMAVKFSYDEYWADCTVDAINKTVSIEKPGEYDRTSENTFSGSSILPGGTIQLSGIALNDTRVWYITNIQVARAMGTLYFLND